MTPAARPDPQGPAGLASLPPGHPNSRHPRPGSPRCAPHRSLLRSRGWWLHRRRVACTTAGRQGPPTTLVMAAQPTGRRARRPVGRPAAVRQLRLTRLFPSPARHPARALRPRDVYPCKAGTAQVKELKGSRTHRRPLDDGPGAYGPGTGGGGEERGDAGGGGRDEGGGVVLNVGQRPAA